MPRKLTNKQIVDGINKVAENYFKAANVKGLSESTRQILESKWEVFREMAILLSHKSPRSLEEIVWSSRAWLVDCERVAAEASK